MTGHPILVEGQPSGNHVFVLHAHKARRYAEWLTEQTGRLHELGDLEQLPPGEPLLVPRDTGLWEVMRVPDELAVPQWQPRPVELDLTVGISDVDLMHQPGRLRLYHMTSAEDGHCWRDFDACCPGCGQHVAYFNPTAYPLQGDMHSLSCPAEIHFSVCCGWRGHLRLGVWEPTEAAPLVAAD